MIKGWQPNGYLIHYVKVGGTCLQKIFCFEKVFLHPLLLFCLLVQNVTCSNACKCIPSAVIKTLPYMPTLERLKAVGGDLGGFSVLSVPLMFCGTYMLCHVTMTSVID